MIDALGVLILQQKSRSEEEKTLKKIRKNLVGLSSMGLDFASYHQYFDQYKDSAQALDLFFTTLKQVASMTTPAPLSQNNQYGLNQNGEDAFYSKPEYYGPGFLLAFFIGVSVAFFILHCLKKKNQKDDKEEDLVFNFFICSSRREVQFIKCLFEKWISFADKELRLGYPDKELFKELNLDEEMNKIENERKKGGADVDPPGAAVEYPLVTGSALDDVAPSGSSVLAPPTTDIVAPSAPRRKVLTPTEIRMQTFLKWANSLHSAAVLEHKPEQFDYRLYLFENLHDVPLSLKNRIILPTSKNRNKKTRKSITKTFATDYFHGNYVQLKNGWKTYLVQAPIVDKPRRTPNVDKFYFLVKDKGIKAVVMLCDFKETSYLTPGIEYHKADRYFPAEKNEEMKFEDFTVKCTALSKEGTITTRTLQLKYDGETEVYEFTHYHYTGWPNESAPEDPTEVVKLLMTVRKTEKVLVHCSAGIGRTSSFVYAEIMYQEIGGTENDSGDVDYVGQLRWLRTKRAESIERPVHFAFSLLVVNFMLFYEVNPRILHPSIVTFRQNMLESYRNSLPEYKKEELET